MAYIIDTERGILKKYLPEPGETEITLPENIQIIGQHAFAECNRLYTVRIPEGVTHILNGAFSDCKDLTFIRFPESLREIGEYAFHGCESLGEVIIPENVDCIQKFAFGACTNLRSVILPKKMTSIGRMAFRSCVKLKKVKMPHTIECLEIGCFRRCISLTSIVIPEGVEIIDRVTFGGCSQLNFVMIPECVKHIAYIDAFYPATVLHFQIKKQLFSIVFSSRLADVFCQPELPENTEKIIKHFIWQNDIDNLKRFLECGFVTTVEEIDQYIRYAIERKHYESQVVLMDYKHEHIGYQSDKWEL